MFKAFVAIVVFRLWVASCRKTPRDADVCGTPACQRAARRYAASINASLDPCDDFYEFVCSGWKQRHASKGATRWSSMMEQTEHVWNQVKEMLVSSGSGQSRLERNVGNLYKGCVDREKRESLGVEPLRRLLKEIGGWPMVGDEFDEDDYDWVRASARVVGHTGIDDVLFCLRLNWGHDLKYILHFVPLFTGDWAGPTLDDGRVSDFAKTIRDDAESDIEDEIRRVLRLKRRLSKVYDFHYDEVWKKARTRTVCRMRELLGDKMNIASYLRIALDGVIPVTDDTRVSFPCTPYIKRVSKIIEATDHRVVANYIGWMVVKKLAYFTTVSIPNDASPVEYKGNDDLGGACLDLVGTLFEKVLEKIYVKRYFDDNSRNELIEMMKLLKYSLRELLENAQWIDDDTRRIAILKLDKMQVSIGYPDWFVNVSTANEYYDMLGDLTEDNFFQSAVKVFQFIRRKKFMTIGTPIFLQETFHPSLIEVNARYNPGRNNLYLPAAMAQLPRYEYGLPAYITYASMGYVLGHEMTHGFDTTGHKYDANRKSRDWWSTSTKKEFLSKSNCFVDQYGNYEPLEGIKLEGRKSLGENIADNGGIRQAFVAWKKYVQLHGNEKKLPLLDYTEEQLFFIAYAYGWCTVQAEYLLKSEVQQGYTPAKYRVLGPLSNNRDFHRAFKCKEGDNMYKNDPCLLW